VGRTVERRLNKYEAERKAKKKPRVLKLKISSPQKNKKRMQENEKEGL